MRGGAGALKLANLSLLVLFPIAWFAPLLRAGVLPIFGLSEISIVSGIATLWREDLLLALLVACFALLAPYAKTLGLVLLLSGRLPARHLGALQWLSKLAMAEVFLVALYIVVVKGVGLGRVEVAWGLYLFTFCVLASLAVALLARQTRH
ncbi:MAG: paraquat-inducible membrane protein A [Alphaproteobacteria bacterium HGW-Alphaproteobacteria-2]|nr:MAG: paraquat-inducible membrane protein A [Alphaproteobacteria bacterium HGW-Alphaproteobacteria-2]